MNIAEQIADEYNLNIPTIYVNELEERDIQRHALGVAEYIKDSEYEIRVGEKRFDEQVDIYTHEVVQTLLAHNNPFYRQLFKNNLARLKDLKFSEVKGSKSISLLGDIIKDELFSEFVASYVGQKVELKPDEVIPLIVGNRQTVILNLQSLERQKMITQMLTGVTGKTAVKEDVVGKFTNRIPLVQDNAMRAGQSAAESLLIAKSKIPEIEEKLRGINMFSIDPDDFYDVLLDASESTSVQGFVRRLAGGLKLRSI